MTVFKLPKLKRNLAFFWLIVLVTCLGATQLFYYIVAYKQILPNEIQRKYILYWTGMYDAKDFYLGSGSEIFGNCSINNCYATSNKQYLPVDQFDAILFHGKQYTIDSYGKPENRSPHQYYVFANLESPMNTPQYKNLENFFNWTMTYRLDSDIVWPYGYYEKTRTNYQLPSVEEIKGKSKKIAWLVSHCMTTSLRKRLYEQINKYIEVDVFGKCGNKWCSRNTSEYCYNFLEENYKFYLSFENSICKDYVTEKLYNVLKRNLIPIVYGGADYKNNAPPMSVIDATNFKSVKELAEYIKSLDENPNQYLTYFEWKYNYTVKTDFKPTLCSLCRKLNEPIERKTYNIYSWWFSQNICKLGKSLPTLLFS